EFLGGASANLVAEGIYGELVVVCAAGRAWGVPPKYHPCLPALLVASRAPGRRMTGRPGSCLAVVRSGVWGTSGGHRMRTAPGARGVHDFVGNVLVFAIGKWS